MDERLKYLFGRYFTGTGSPEEEEELLRLIYRATHDEDIKALMDGVWDKISKDHKIPDEHAARILAAILPRKTKHRVMRRWAAAAAVLILLATGSYIYFN